MREGSNLYGRTDDKAQAKVGCRNAHWYGTDARRKSCPLCGRFLLKVVNGQLQWPRF
jgi:hypothetical protein